MFVVVLYLIHGARDYLGEEAGTTATHCGSWGEGVTKKVEGRTNRTNTYSCSTILVEEAKKHTRQLVKTYIRYLQTLLITTWYDLSVWLFEVSFYCCFIVRVHGTDRRTSPQRTRYEYSNGLPPIAVYLSTIDVLPVDGFVVWILLLFYSFGSADTVRYSSIIGKACILTSWTFGGQTRAQRRHTMDHGCGEDVMNEAEGRTNNSNNRRSEEGQQQNNSSTVQSIYIIIEHYSIEPRALL